MRARSLFVEGFRNLATQEVALHERLTVLYGDNGQGKTNLLEALYLLAALRSHRTARLRECIAWGAPIARVVGEIERRDRRVRVEVRLAPARQVLVDGKPLRGTRDWRGEVQAVLFTPEDLMLARGSPELRRRLLDRGVFAASPAHLADLLDYERALRARNLLLRDRCTAGPQLEAHTAVLGRLGGLVVERRLRWIAAIRRILAPVFEEIAAIPQAPGIAYETSVRGIDDGSSAAVIAERLHRHWDEHLSQDLARGYTGVGPHADDLALTLDGRPLRVAGSQGQQRAFVLALKLAEIRLAEERLGEPPVLLLDDVGSELDATRRAQLFAHLERMQGQVVATTTAAEQIPIRGPRLQYRVEKGRLERTGSYG